MGYSNNLLGGNVSKLTRSEDGCHQIHTGAANCSRHGFASDLTHNLWPRLGCHGIYSTS